MKILKGFQKYFVKISRKFKFIIKFSGIYLENLTCWKSFYELKKINKPLVKIQKKNYGKISGKLCRILMRLKNFEKILTNFIFFIGKLQRNPEMIFMRL